MKLFIQIPCLNEEDTLPQTLADLPREIPGIHSIEYLVIDDGSTDRTVEVAKQCGAHHVLSLGSNRGLATAFRLGVDYALSHGADIVVNTDGDNQYQGADIHLLVTPVLKDQADIVVGSRPIVDHPEFGFLKKFLQLSGSWVLRLISKTTVRDAPSVPRLHRVISSTMARALSLTVPSPSISALIRQTPPRSVKWSLTSHRYPG